MPSPVHQPPAAGATHHPTAPARASATPEPPPEDEPAPERQPPPDDPASDPPPAGDPEPRPDEPPAGDPPDRRPPVESPPDETLGDGPATVGSSAHPMRTTGPGFAPTPPRGPHGAPATSALFVASPPPEGSHRELDRRAPLPPAAPPRHSPLTTALLAAALLLALLPAPASAAFTPRTQERIAVEAARLAPPDLARQIERREAALLAGVGVPFRDGSSAHRNAGPEGILDRVIVDEAQRAVQYIREHRSFDDVVHQLGVVSHYVAAANFPLNTTAEDPREAEYWADYARYVETAEPRLPLVFYGLAPGLDARPDVSPLISLTLARGRRLYPLVGREYRRIGFASGINRFDDRSTAFGVASLSFSHAVTDVARVMRWIWLQAGGGDTRDALPDRGRKLLRIPRVPIEDRPGR